MRRRISCGIDPGQDKFGLAITENDELLFSAVIPIERLENTVALLSSGRWSGLSVWGQEKFISPVELDSIGEQAKSMFFYIGNGTGSEAVQKRMREAGLRCLIIDESYTTEEGRVLYWHLHQPRGLWRFVPTTLRVPPRPIDDMAAWAIIIKAKHH